MKKNEYPRFIINYTKTKKFIIVRKYLLHNKNNFSKWLFSFKTGKWIPSEEGGIFPEECKGNINNLKYQE